MLRALRQGLVKIEHRAYAVLRQRIDTGGSESKRPQHLITGERGEDEAHFYLQKLGYTIVARRWRAGNLRGDLDLVGWDGDTLVIFEVKTRSARDFAVAEAEVDESKRRMLRRMASAYVRQFPERHRDSVPVRFDVVAVYLLRTGVEIEHFHSAFSRNSDG